jgi:hypothetical protein
VIVSGTLYSNLSTVPQGVFFVTDPYGNDEPRGTMALIPAGKVNGEFAYKFSFVISLQAKRSTNTPNGRPYSLFVGGTDSDGTGGKTITVLVPINFAEALAAFNAGRLKPTPNPPRPVHHHRVHTAAANLHH